jgi:hypothetical protein
LKTVRNKTQTKETDRRCQRRRRQRRRRCHCQDPLKIPTGDVRLYKALLCQHMLPWISATYPPSKPQTINQCCRTSCPACFHTLYFINVYK